ncbi:MAG: type II toxin-antitoxin system HipA family toxin YjjJ [Stagnimonas sp.]|nr:type II toxin-antitoxin system HipA family toxin YjjJ [Stagnimonas sp.]
MSVAILNRLARSTASAAELALLTGLPQPTLSRRLAALRAQVLPMGAPKLRRYGLLSGIRDLPPEVPVYRVSEAGEAHKIGALYSLAAGEFWFESCIGQKLATRLYPDLPWWIQDLRPQGFLGRSFPRRHADLQLPADIRDWDAATILYALTRRGDDLPGDLLIGDGAYSRWWERQRQPENEQFRFDDTHREKIYPQLANEVMQGEVAGSSAGGEQPKFLFGLKRGAQSREVIVKFSPPVGETIGQRWSDLLIAEHHALQALRNAGIEAAQSEIIQAAGRTFLEVQRFDRVGLWGRCGVVSIGVADNEFTGIGAAWPLIARALQAEKRLDAADVERIERISAFGHLIANTDMHPGNLGLLHDGLQRPGYGQFALAPVYDMLPMRYAPVGGEVSMPSFTVPAPVGGLIDAYQAMREPAQRFWRTVADEPLISTTFRATAAANVGSLARL